MEDSTPSQSSPEKFAQLTKSSTQELRPREIVLEVFWPDVESTLGTETSDNKASDLLREEAETSADLRREEGGPRLEGSPTGPPRPPKPPTNRAGGGGPGTELLRRYTEVQFKQREAEPVTGDLTFCLRVQQTTATGHAIDVRVPAGKPHASILVYAFSNRFKVSPEPRRIKVFREEDSEVASFKVSGRDAGEGEVSLLIYDEFRLVGSLSVRLILKEVDGEQVFDRIGADIFRDPAKAQPVRRMGITLQASLLDEDKGKISYHAIVPKDVGGILVPEPINLDHSPEPFNTSYVQSVLASMRKDVEFIEKNLNHPEILGVSSTKEALEGLRISLLSAGAQIHEDLLSPAVRTLLDSLEKGTVVNWVIASKELDVIPWELAYNPVTRKSLHESIVLVRVPVRGDIEQKVLEARQQDGEAQNLPTPGQRRLVYVLGADVAGPESFPLLRQVVESARPEYEVVTNFDGEARTKVTVPGLAGMIDGAEIIHLLCHGIVEKGDDLYLELEKNSFLGRLKPTDVLGIRIRPGAVVFVNACSSASATFGATGLTTFGWNFTRVKAAYIGTLAPVTTRLALRFAREFFDATLGRGLSVAEAVFRARQALVGDPDPTWILYVVYGDLHTELFQDN